MFFGLLKPKPAYPAVDRRREPRYEVEDEFILEFRAKNSNYLGSSRDISLHGVRFVTTCKLKPKKEIGLIFKFPEAFPGKRRVLTKAQVIRVYKPQGVARYRVGCRLLHPSAETEDILRQYIAWLDFKKRK